LVRSAKTWIEVDTRVFSGHSLRIGGATDLFALGVTPMTIQLLGLWSSDIYRIYTRICGDTVLGVSARMPFASGEALEATFPEYVQSARL